MELDEERLIPDEDVERVLELDEALRRLALQHPRPAQAVEQAYFGGLTNAETAEVLGISPPTVKREWRTARLWLMREIRGG